MISPEYNSSQDQLRHFCISFSSMDVARAHITSFDMKRYLVNVRCLTFLTGSLINSNDEDFFVSFRQEDFVTVVDCSIVLNTQDNAVFFI